MKSDMDIVCDVFDSMAAMIEMTMCFVFVSSFMEEDILKKHATGIVITNVIYLIFNYITMRIAVYSVCRFLIYAGMALFAQFLFYRKYYDRILVMTVTYLVFFMLFDYSVVAVMAYISGTELGYFQEMTSLRICEIILSKSSLFLSVLLLRRKMAGLKKLNRKHLLCIFGISGIIMLFAFYIFDNFMQRNRILASETMMFLLLLLIEILSIYSFAVMAEKRENEEKLQLIHLYNQMLQKSLDEEKNSFALWSGRVHDYKNHVLYMLELLKTKEYAKLEEYMQEESGVLNHQSHYVRSGYPGIDVIINSKTVYAGSLGIHVFCNIHIPLNLLLNEGAMVTILGNLLDNAIQAETQMEKKSIEVNISYRKGNVYIKIVNHKKSGDIDFKTTKKEDAQWHGIGLRSVEQQIKKLHGDFRLIQEEDQVISMVVLYDIPRKQ